MPNYDLNDALYNQFNLLLKSLQGKLNPIFNEYISNNKDNMKPTKEIIRNILEVMKPNNIALISANSSKKKLRNIGVKPQFLIVTGGPLFFEDYKIIDPNLSEKAIQGIKKKCERLLIQIKNENWNEKDLIFIYERENPTDKLILNRTEEISNLIGKKLITFNEIKKALEKNKSNSKPLLFFDAQFFHVEGKRLKNTLKIFGEIVSQFNYNQISGIIYQAHSLFNEDTRNIMANFYFNLFNNDSQGIALLKARQQCKSGIAISSFVHFGIPWKKL